MLGTSHDAHDGHRPIGVEVRAGIWRRSSRTRRGVSAREPDRSGRAADTSRAAADGLWRARHVKLVKESRVVDHTVTACRPGLDVRRPLHHGAAYTPQQAVDAVFHRSRNTPRPRLPDRRDAAPGRQHRSDGQFPEGGGAARSRRHYPDTLKRIATTYGTGYDRVPADGPRDAPFSASRSAHRCDVIGAEILYAAREEMALTLADALIRRTEAGGAGHPGTDAVERAAAIMADAHGWNDERTRTRSARWSRSLPTRRLSHFQEENSVFS